MEIFWYLKFCNFYQNNFNNSAYVLKNWKFFEISFSKFGHFFQKFHKRNLESHVENFHVFGSFWPLFCKYLVVFDVFYDFERMLCYLIMQLYLIHVLGWLFKIWSRFVQQLTGTSLKCHFYTAYVDLYLLNLIFEKQYFRDFRILGVPNTRQVGVLFSEMSIFAIFSVFGIFSDFWAIRTSRPG